MSQPVLPNPTNFLAVALVINRSRDGPNFVFHYPPQVRPPPGQPGFQYGSPEEARDADNAVFEHLNQPVYSFDDPLGAPSSTDHTPSHGWDDHRFTESGIQIVPWEQVAGFSTRDLASILTPGRAYHKKLFQLSLDPLYCVSCPIHVPESGVWKKKKKKKPDKAKSVRTDDGGTAPSDADSARLQTNVSNGTDGSQADVKEKSDEVDDKRASMTMFNLVFILHPRKHQVKELVATLYLNIIRKISKAYKYSQQSSDFVWKESKRISALKEKGREESES